MYPQSGATADNQPYNFLSGENSQWKGLFVNALRTVYAILLFICTAFLLIITSYQLSPGRIKTDVTLHKLPLVCFAYLQEVSKTKITSKCSK